MTHKKHSAAAVIAAVTGSAGIKAVIARRLGMHRHTVDRYLVEYPSAMLAYKNEVETTGDVVEQVILDSIKNKDIETAKWYARFKLKDRGYVERYEIKEFREMSDADLLSFITARAGTAGRSDARGGAAGADSEEPTLH